MAKIRQQQTDIEYARMAWELALSGKRLVAASRALEAWRKLVDPASPEVQAAWKEVIKGLHRPRSSRPAEPPARAGGSSRRAGLLSQEPGDCGRPARSPGRSSPLPAGRSGRPCGAAARRPDQAVLDAPRAGWPGAAHFRRLTQTWRSAGASRRWDPNRRGLHVRVSRIVARQGGRDRQLRGAWQARRGRVAGGGRGGPGAFSARRQDVRVEPREGAVELSWIPPHGVFEVRVVRKRGAPPADPATATGSDRRSTRPSIPT